MTGQRLSVREIVKDLRSGLGDSELMTKYDLNAIQLESVFQKLIDADFITSLELWERSRLSDTQITRAFVEAQRAIDRSATFRIRPTEKNDICEADTGKRPSRRGRVEH